MKKMLSLLASFGMIATTSATVVAYGQKTRASYDEIKDFVDEIKKEPNKKINDDNRRKLIDFEKEIIRKVTEIKYKTASGFAGWTVNSEEKFLYFINQITQDDDRYLKYLYAINEIEEINLLDDLDQEILNLLD